MADAAHAIRAWHGGSHVQRDVHGNAKPHGHAIANRLAVTYAQRDGDRPGHTVAHCCAVTHVHSDLHSNAACYSDGEAAARAANASRAGVALASPAAAAPASQQPLVSPPALLQPALNARLQGTVQFEWYPTSTLPEGA